MAKIVKCAEKVRREKKIGNTKKKVEINMKVSKREAFFTLTAVLGLFLVAAGATFRSLFFLSFFGGAITLVSLHLYYRELKKKGKKFFWLGLFLMPALFCIVASGILPFFFRTYRTSETEHSIITGSDCQNWVYPCCCLDVAVDTDRNLLSFHYDGPGAIVLPAPTPYCSPLSHWEASDEQGLFYRERDPIPPSASVNLFYCNLGPTWIKVRVVWVYTTFYWSTIVESTVRLYVPHMSRWSTCDC